MSISVKKYVDVHVVCKDAEICTVAMLKQGQTGIRN
jgi:hypothetical protein